jgi:hypothetical protein
MEKSIVDKLKPAMLDPSILCVTEFWQFTKNLQEIIPTIYVPKNILKIKDTDFHEFYGGYLHRLRILSIEEVIERSREAFQWFSWEEYSKKIPEQFVDGFTKLRGRLEESYLPIPIQNILLDEFVFLTTQSSVLSRMKKTFKLLEKFDAIPLLNLEKIVPKEWQKSVSGLKKAIDFVNWTALIGTFSLWLGPISGVLGGSAVTGIRLLLIDPA